MKKFFCLFFYLFCNLSVRTQNIGIGTDNPQQTLHVAGNVRIDSLSGETGLVRYNSSGDIQRLPYSGSASQVLLGNGSWGNAPGTLPAGAIVSTLIYNDTSLIRRGFRLLGTLPFSTVYSNYPGSVFNEGQWEETYYKGNVSKYTPPFFDTRDIIVGADSVMYIYSDNSFYAYNPITDAWRYMFFNSGSGLNASSGAKAVWTGTEILVYGGFYTGSDNNGFRYNPSTNIWTPIPSNNQPSPRRGFAMHLFGQKLVVWGGSDQADTRLNTGAVLDLVSNTWSPMSFANAPAPSSEFSYTPTNQNKLIIWGGRVGSTSPVLTSDGAIYDLTTNIWTPMSSIGAPTARSKHTAVWDQANNELIVFGGNSGSNILNTGGKYNISTNTWTAISSSGAPALEYHSAYWTGGKMLISGGSEPLALKAIPSANAFLYDPTTDSWSYSGAIRYPRIAHLTIRVGDILIVFGGTTIEKIGGRENNYGGYPKGARYFLSTTTSEAIRTVTPNDLYLYIKE